MTKLGRRDLLTGTALLLVGSRVPRAREVEGQLPWRPGSPSAPRPVQPGRWEFFSAAEAAAVGAIADRLIPPDPVTLGGKDAGCVVFIDRQLAGGYGSREGLYVRGPFHKGAKSQGPQSPQTPRDLYRSGLLALDRYCRSGKLGGAEDNIFVQLTAEQQDEVLQGLESATVQLEGVEGPTFFEQILKDVQQGFFADPIYGGNHDMCGWKMIGFPGARYDYTDWVGRHNERYPHPPVSIAGRDDWNSHQS
ncbi:MAG: gluconate 2-dehydrogenase subunit 3 family protein [Proteobacteria bacterium]|nr:gluconate 2-dehydrogenase subunit 3 family protein [Pseudomonadota bacterium]